MNERDAAGVFRAEWDRRRFLRVFGSTVAVGVTGSVLAACGGDDEPGSGSGATGGGATDTEVTFLSPTPGPDFIEIPAYVAEEMGYFEQEGITVKTEYPGSSSRAAQLLSAGRADIALPEPSFVLSSVNQGTDVRSVWVLGTGSFFGMAVLPDSPITEWSREQIEGKRIGISEFAGGEIPLLRGALAMEGLSEDDVELVVVGDGGAEAADAITSGDIDVYSTGDVGFAQLEAMDVVLRRITPEIVNGFPRLTAMVPGAYLDANRETVVKYLRGWSKGIVFMNANPRAAAEIAIEYAPENLGEIPVEDVQAAFVEALLLKGLTAYFDPGSDVYQKIGMQDLQGWEDYMNYLIEAGADSDEGVRLDEPVDLSAVVTNDLIDDINDFDYAAIEDEAANHPSE